MAITLRTTLTTAISITSDSMILASVTGVTSGMFAMLGNELVLCGTPNATTLVVPITRAQDSTKPTAHSVGSWVMIGSAPNFTDVGGFNNAVNGNSGNFNTLISQQTDAYAASVTATLTAGQIAAGILLLDGSGGVSWTLPTAALLLAAFPGAMVGSTYRVHLRNTGSGTVTIVTGTGITLSGTATTATTLSRDLFLRVTSVTPGAETFTVYFGGSSAF